MSGDDTQPTPTTPSGAPRTAVDQTGTLLAARAAAPMLVGGSVHSCQDDPGRCSLESRSEGAENDVIMLLSAV
jgi:hypothetical protein